MLFHKQHFLMSFSGRRSSYLVLQQSEHAGFDSTLSLSVEEDLPEVQGALNPDDADVTSAYSPEQGFKEMDVDELNRCLNTNGISLLLDVRTQEEFVDGHVPGAKNVPLDELSAKVREGKLDEYKDKAIAVICQMGSRSAQATVRLSKVLLFTDVTTVKGGTNEWIARGYPVE